MKIPFVDLYAQYLSIREEIDHAIEEVIKQTAFIRGPFVERFEKEKRKLQEKLSYPHKTLSY